MTYQLTAHAGDRADGKETSVEVVCEPEPEPEPTLPDLVVTDVSGGEVVVTNVGEGPAGAFTVLIGGTRHPVAGLLPDASASIPVNLCEGGWSIEADVDGAIEEIDEENNSREAEIIC